MKGLVFSSVYTLSFLLILKFSNFAIFVQYRKVPFFITVACYESDNYSDDISDDVPFLDWPCGVCGLARCVWKKESFRYASTYPCDKIEIYSFKTLNS